MRVHKKESPLTMRKKNNNPMPDEVIYKSIYEDIKNYLVFKISITTGLNERLVYMEVLDYIERIHREATK